MNDSSRFPPHDPPGSGAQSLIGYTVDLSEPDGSARVALALEPGHLNRNGSLHGGIHAMLLDSAAGFAASRLFTGDLAELVPSLTLALTTNFIAGPREGIVTVTGWIRGGGYKIVYADAELRDAAGRLCSTASGVFKRAAA